MAEQNPLLALLQAGLSIEDIVALGTEYARRKQVYGEGDAGTLFPEQASGNTGSLANLAGGAALLGPAATMQGIKNSFQLGRAGLAAQLANDSFARNQALAADAANPFNTVKYFSEAGKMGFDPITGATVKPLGATRYDRGNQDFGDQYVRDFLSNPDTEPSDLERTRQAFSGPNAGDAATFFRQKPEDLARMFGGKAYAEGGGFTADNPILMMEQLPDGTYRMRGVAGEAGPEKIEMTPQRFGTGAKGRGGKQGPGGARMFGKGGSGLAGLADYMPGGKTYAEHKRRTALAAEHSRVNSAAIKGYTGERDADGSFVVDGVRYAGNTGKLGDANNMTNADMARRWGASSNTGYQVGYKAQGRVPLGAAARGAPAVDAYGAPIDPALGQAARLFGNSWNGGAGPTMTPISFIDAARGGDVPGLQGLTLRDWNTWDQKRKALYASILMGTGQIADPAEIDAYLQRGAPASIGGGYARSAF